MCFSAFTTDACWDIKGPRTLTSQFPSAFATKKAHELPHVRLLITDAISRSLLTTDTCLDGLAVAGRTLPISRSLLTL
jgi:hypothetical protein